MPAKDEIPPIIIKRKKVVAGGGHHGGAWKVAYADFVTAMMAFFLLMWLLNATTEEQRKGLSDYFNPTIPISRTSAGGAGMLEGSTPFDPEVKAGASPEGAPPKPSHRDAGKTVADDMASPVNAKPGAHPAHPGAGAADTESDVEAQGGKDAVGREPADSSTAGGTARGAETDADRRERARLEQIQRKIAVATQQTQDGSLARHFVFHITPEGLVIEIIDADDRPLFDSASADPTPVLKLLTQILVPVLGETVNDIAVVGHTDAVPYGSTGYTNWELSADRANTARRLLMTDGLPEARISRVSGKAAVEPLVPDPNAPQNRRIALILLRDPPR
jgi:chemotaxis protein MotB